MAEPNPGAVVVGAGTLYVAPTGTPEPAAGVFAPVTTPAVSVPWPSAWTQLGYTSDGSEFDFAPKFDPLEVAELLIPIKYVSSMVEMKLTFALAEITAAHLRTALNGGTVATAAGITTFTPPVIGAEVRVMLGWDSLDGLERWIWRQCIQVGTVKQEHKKAPAKNQLPVEFNLEFPTSGTSPFVTYFDSTRA